MKYSISCMRRAAIAVIGMTLAPPLYAHKGQGKQSGGQMGMMGGQGGMMDADMQKQMEQMRKRMDAMMTQ